MYCFIPGDSRLLPGLVFVRVCTYVYARARAHIQFVGVDRGLGLFGCKTS